MNSRTIDDMNEAIKANLHKVPWHPHVVAGVHKSGMLAASIWASHLNVPVVPLRQLWEAPWVYAGLRAGIKDQDTFLMKATRVLVLEDAAGTGKTSAKEFAKLPKKFKYFKVCVFGTKPGVPGFDLVCDVCSGPRIFEWNWRDNKLLESSILDIDGVLCPDPPTPEERTGPYIKHIQTARPLYVPKRKVLVLATSRLEKYRKHTEQWLAKNKIEYGTLYMAQFDTPAERRKFGNFRTKANVYANRKDARLFVESHDKQAAWIQRETGRPVFSVESRRLV